MNSGHSSIVRVVAWLVEALRCKPESRSFDALWYRRNFLLI
jgi:hypothetical protein